MKRCPAYARLRRIFPFEVILNRFAAPLWVLIFGITIYPCVDGLSFEVKQIRIVGTNAHDRKREI